MTTETKEEPKTKRTWVYIHPPEFYEVYCDNGGKINKDHKTAWSEFEHMIWCYDCKLDMRGFDGIFGGPIPVQATWMLMGRHAFYRFNLVTKKIEVDVHGRGKIYYRPHAGLTKKLVKKP